ncbi:MAG: tetratricopeptide repeat protein [Fimbriimonadaceae bacterium]|nr:tetratricopeptide repeat protein [Chitinophagales bacterium]
MKHLLIYICAFFFSLQMFAQDNSSRYTKANELYESKNYNQAINMYEDILKANGASAEIYYNLGNAYYKNGQMGRAILNYERCLKLDPGNEDVIFNLHLANLRIKDQLQPVGELFIIQWWKNFINLGTAKTFGIISIIFIWISLSAFALYRISKKLKLRKLGFYSALITFIVFIFLLIATLSKMSYDKNYQFAIILSPSAIIKSGPSESETNLTILHEGLKVQILDTDKNWTKVKMANGVIGWLMDSAIEKI